MGGLVGVVRGGSWNNNHINARAAYRNRNHPNNRNNNLGFRVVCGASMLLRLLAGGKPAGSALRLPRKCVLEMHADHGRRAEVKEEE
jgi:hypothetical protein